MENVKGFFIGLFLFMISSTILISQEINSTKFIGFKSGPLIQWINQNRPMSDVEKIIGCYVSFKLLPQKPIEPKDLNGDGFIAPLERLTQSIRPIPFLGKKSLLFELAILENDSIKIIDSRAYDLQSFSREALGRKLVLDEKRLTEYFLGKSTSPAWTEDYKAKLMLSKFNKKLEVYFEKFQKNETQYIEDPGFYETSMGLSPFEKFDFSFFSLNDLVLLANEGNYFIVSGARIDYLDVFQDSGSDNIPYYSLKLEAARIDRGEIPYYDQSDLRRILKENDVGNSEEISNEFSVLPFYTITPILQSRKVVVVGGSQHLISHHLSSIFNEPTPLAIMSTPCPPYWKPTGGGNN